MRVSFDFYEGLFFLHPAVKLKYWFNNHNYWFKTWRVLFCVCLLTEIRLHVPLEWCLKKNMPWTLQGRCHKNNSILKYEFANASSDSVNIPVSSASSFEIILLKIEDSFFSCTVPFEPLGSSLVFLSVWTEVQKEKKNLKMRTDFHVISPFLLLR